MRNTKNKMRESVNHRGGTKYGYKTDWFSPRLISASNDQLRKLTSNERVTRRFRLSQFVHSAITTKRGNNVAFRTTPAQ